MATQISNGRHPRTEHPIERVSFVAPKTHQFQLIDSNAITIGEIHLHVPKNGGGALMKMSEEFLLTVTQHPSEFDHGRRLRKSLWFQMNPT